MKTFKIQYMLVLLALLFGAMPAASASDRFYVKSANINPGETKQLSFILENSQEFFGFQADIELPVGLTFVTSDGKADISLSSRAKRGSYSIVSNLLSESKVRFGAFSASHTAFSGHDDVLLYVMVSASEDFAGGTVSLNKIRFIDSDDRDVRLPDSSTEIFRIIPTENIMLSQTSAQLKAGESVTLTASVLPENTTDKTVSWSSSDETVATVDAEGNVTAVAIGEAVITAKCGSVTAVCKVKVLPTLAKSITLSHESWSSEEGESFTLVATVLPENTTDKTVSWSSSDETVATVDAEGNVSVLKKGYCTITASTQDGSDLSAECVITIATGIDDVFTDSMTRFDVYTLQGVLLKKGCSRDYLKQLSTGAYILRQGNISKKVIIR